MTGAEFIAKDLGMKVGGLLVLDRVVTATLTVMVPARAASVDLGLGPPLACPEARGNGGLQEL